MHKFRVIPSYVMAIALLGSYVLSYTPILISVIYLFVGSWTYLIYIKDKRAAKKQLRRTPEDTLHLLALIGGWPAAIFAQERLRHKTQKTSFRIVFWITAILNSLAFIGLHTEVGQHLIRRLSVYAITTLSGTQAGELSLWLFGFSNG